MAEHHCAVALGKLYLHLCACVTKLYNLVRATGGDLFGWQSNCAPGVFMTNVTCGLTTKKPGSAPCPTLVIEYGTTFLLHQFLAFDVM